MSNVLKVFERKNAIMEHTINSALNIMLGSPVNSQTDIEKLRISSGFDGTATGRYSGLLAIS